MTENVKPSYWSCDECQRTLNHGEYRYTCTVCEDFDYCEACMTRVDPPHCHRMVKELAFGRPERKACSPKTMTDIIHTAMQMYADRQCLGVRDVDKGNPSIYTDSYSWLTFKTVSDRAKNFGHGLKQLIEPRGYLAICSLNRPEWVITDFACMFQGIISVPIDRLLSEREMTHVINNTQVSVVVCDGGILERFVKVADQCPSLRHIVCMEPFKSVIDRNVTVHDMQDIEASAVTSLCESVTIAPNDVITVLYTSGSSGVPKGVQVTESAFRSAFGQWCTTSSADHIYFSYRSLAWAADRDGVIATLICGGRTGFSTGDVSRLMEELALIRPSDFSCPPSICNQIHAEFATALLLLTAHLSTDDAQAEEQRLLQRFSELIPTRCKAICLGGALVSPAILCFMERCFPHCSIEQSYGITECGSIVYNDMIDPSVEYRLESVPDLGYTIDDQPYPRGELLAKTTQMFSGYINDPQQTGAALTEDGFFRTGDIVELRSSSTDSEPHLHVIDRKKNFFKLAQGQFIAPEYLQSLFIQSSFVDQIFIHADLTSDTLTAVVVPNRDNTQLFLKQHPLTSPLLFDAILADLRSIGERESLRPHEIPSRLIIDFQPFTPENGLLTSSMKLCRYKLAAHYAQQFKSNTTDVQQRLKQIIESVRGKTIGEQESSLISSSGTDSLSTVRLSKLIEKDLGISIPLHILFDPSITLQKLTDLIQNPSQLHAFSTPTISQLISDNQWHPPLGEVRPRRASADHPSVIFITGTTGFVGCFLLAELLRVYPSPCRMICLVRCDDPSINRLRQTMISYQIWNEDDDEHRLTVLRGDLSQSSFGLDPATFQSLVDEVDLIFHCAANVNFTLSAHQLAQDNIFGTREVLRLATSHPSTSIPLHFISTLSVRSPKNSGYAQTKWMAESLVSQAIKAGLSAKIYRLGLIGPHSRTGIANPKDLYTLLFSAMMRMHCYPQVLRGQLTVLPVDVTARSLVHLSRLSNDPPDHIYHLVHAKYQMQMDDLVEGLHRCDTGMRVAKKDEWQGEVQRLCDEKSEYECVKEFLLNGQFGEVSDDEYQGAVSDLDLPAIDKEYAYRWLKSILLRHKLLAPP